jgi:hypothetical protein
MPHGSLTPLGNRLRSVLATLRPNTLHRDNTSKPLQCPASYTTNAINALTPRPNPRTTRARHVPGTTIRRHAQHEATAPALESLDEMLGGTTPSTLTVPPAVKTTNALSNNPTPQAPIRSISRRQENRRTKVDYLSNELRAIGKSELAPRRPPEWKRENHFAHRSQHAKQSHAENKKRHASDYIPPLENAGAPTLTRILASYIRHATNESNELRAEWMASAAFKLAPKDRRFLARMGYGEADVEAWAAMVTEPDSPKAADYLQARVKIHGIRSVPFPIISYILRRPYITAIALRIFMEHMWNITTDLNSSGTTLSPDAIFLVFSRLARHARHVWPAALASVADYLVQFLPDIKPNRDGDVASTAQLVTFMLNKAMFLVSEPTAVNPFKDVNYQEAAVIRILSAMAEHETPLQIDREGYRAVIRLQLAMGKTDNEQQWAALKALSWPPWKEDRTRMDSELGPEHGISRARATLNRMKEAGYAPRSWEEVAGVYTGWDVDGTPTIQTRVVLPVWHEGDENRNFAVTQRHNPSLWAARIKTTRTIQEAWACYLAFEDAQLPADQSVLLAILEKLHKEDLRLRKLATTNEEDLLEHGGPLRKIFPGDTKEVDPLPPSTHLYTYTKTSPPSAHEFYTQLQDHSIDLRDQCLAFLVTNAATFKDGVEYVRTAASRYPPVGGVHTLDVRLPDVLFFAYIRFLSRYSNAHPPRFLKRRAAQALSLDNPSAHLADTQFNFQHNLIQAIWLLKERRPLFLPAWNAVLNALSHDKSYKTMHLTERHATAVNSRNTPDLDSNTIIAYRLTQQVLRLLQDQNMVPDTYGFLAICQSTENVGIACWGILAHDHKSIQTTTDGLDATKKDISTSVLEAQELLATQRPYGRLEQYFKLLVGEGSFAGLNKATRTSDTITSTSNDMPASPPLPRLLAVPDPALLHAYIRALGWHGSHVRILTMLKWMVKHQHELAETSDRARNGAKLMRRTIVAVRVFLERSWLSANSIFDYNLATSALEAARDDKSELLKRLEARAYDSQVEEARALVDSVEAWGGWATDEEVEAYCRQGRFSHVR